MSVPTGFPLLKYFYILMSLIKGIRNRSRLIGTTPKQTIALTANSLIEVTAFLANTFSLLF